MAQVTTNTQIDTINVLTPTSSAANTDVFLVQRGATSYKLQKQNLKLDDSAIITSTSSSTLSSASTVHDALELIGTSLGRIDSEILNAIATLQDSVTTKAILEERLTGIVSAVNTWTTRAIRPVMDFGGFIESFDVSANSFTLSVGTYIITASFGSVHSPQMLKLIDDDTSDENEVFLDINGQPCISSETNYGGAKTYYPMEQVHLKTVISIDTPRTFRLQQRSLAGSWGQFHRGDGGTLNAWTNTANRNSIGGHVEIEKINNLYASNASLFTIDGNITTYTETWSRYHTLNDGQIKITLNDIPTNFTLYNGAYQIRIKLSYSSYIDIVTSDSSLIDYPVFTSLNAGTYTISIEDMYSITSNSKTRVVNVNFDVATPVTYALT